MDRKRSRSRNKSAIPTNQRLYDRIKAKIYKEQPVHSLYRSARIQKEYKKAGGKYDGQKPSPNEGIRGWFRDEWISLNDYVHRGDIVPCGNAHTQEDYGEYPLCRPLHTATRLGKQTIRSMITEKNKLKHKSLRKKSPSRK